MPPAASKVAKLTAWFWVMKICATTVGETGGDLLSMTLKIGYAASSILLVSGFLVALTAQLRAKQFNPWLYWAVILATSTAGTTISDYLDRSLGLGYATGATLLAGTLVVVLVAWRLILGSINVDRIVDPRVEAFYWAAILVSNTLGTALGDFLADSSGLGYGMSNLLISCVLAAILAAYLWTRTSRTVLFWMAFVLTRPFGATMGDLLTKPTSHGGLGFGTVGSSLVLLVLLIATIVWDTRRQARGPSHSA